MRIQIDELEVLFPYSFIYPEQYEYMKALKRGLDQGGPCVLEMPSGTGKTVSLLAFIVSYKCAYPTRVAKFVYCSRTVSEISKVMEEMKRVLAYRVKKLGKAEEEMLCISLSSRKNLCIHPRVSQRPVPGSTQAEAANASVAAAFVDSADVDSKCRDLTMPWVRENPDLESCEFYEDLLEQGASTKLHGVYSLEDLREIGYQKHWCPYFLARQMVQLADIVVFSYQYMLDPSIASMVSKEFPADSVVVFDEAHNIDNVCIDAFTVRLTRSDLEQCTRNLDSLATTINREKEADAEKLRAEYERLVAGLSVPESISEDITAPLLSTEIVNEAVPGNIRKAEHFVNYLRRIVSYLRESKLNSSYGSVSEKPRKFLLNMITSDLAHQSVEQETRTLRFCSSRLSSLLRALQVSEIHQYSRLSLLTTFLTLLGSYGKGFVVLTEAAEGIRDATIHFCCLDASLALAPVLKKYHCTVITSGTLSPLSMFQKMLNFTPTVSMRLEMSMHRPCLCPLVVTKGSDQVPVSSKYDERMDRAVVRNYGNLLIEVSSVVPDGIVCFFTSYHFMETIVGTWNEMGLLSTLLKKKLLFVETTHTAETSLALENYRKACSSGRGAVLFSVARGKVSEGIDFDHHYGRCVIVYGIPFVDTRSRVLAERLDYLRDQNEIRDSDFLNFDAMRTTAQCVGRVIRGKSDYGIMIFADRRYNRADKRNKLPQWITQYLVQSHLNLSTDVAVGLVRSFLREMAQPTSKEDEIGVSLLTKECLAKKRQQEELQRLRAAAAPANGASFTDKPFPSVANGPTPMEEG
mmetsp:Transcript_13954/g.55062  ORF Transcript_13954/g.55062 Transcript_13954/m.55062 type:complete len:803 (+) Transcript_13954:51-2459(+)